MMRHRPILFSKGLLALATLAAVSLLAAPRSARASIEIALQEAGVNGGAVTVVATGADFSSASFSGTYGDFNVQVFGGSSSNGSALSTLLSSTTTVTNNDGSGHVLHLWVTQNNYNLPAGTQLNVESGMSGTLTNGTVTLSNIYQAWADKNNNLFGTSDFTNGPQTAIPTGSTFDTGSANGTFSRLSTPYSVTSEVNFDMSANGIANYSSHVKLTATPEPTTLVSAVAGLGVLGGLGWVRRRRAAAA